MHILFVNMYMYSILKIEEVPSKFVIMCQNRSDIGQVPALYGMLQGCCLTAVIVLCVRFTQPSRGESLCSVYYIGVSISSCPRERDHAANPAEISQTLVHTMWLFLLTIHYGIFRHNTTVIFACFVPKNIKIIRHSKWMLQVKDISVWERFRTDLLHHCDPLVLNCLWLWCW